MFVAEWVERAREVLYTTIDVLVEKTEQAVTLGRFHLVILLGGAAMSSSIPKVSGVDVMEASPVKIRSRTMTKLT
jgi:tRNA A37 threonylcarbamoyltransferase TsaD